MLKTIHSPVFFKVFSFFLGWFLFSFFLFLSPPEGLTLAGRNLIAVLSLMVVWWMTEAVPIAVTALVPLALFPALGIMASSDLAPNYGHQMVFLFFGGFLIALAMEKCDLHKRVALFIITKVGLGLKQLVLGFMLSSALLSMWVSNTATTLMLLPVAMAVVRQIAAQAELDGKPGPEAERVVTIELGCVLMLALAYSSSIGGVGTLIGTAPNVVLSGFYQSQFPDKPEITFFGWMVFALPLVILFLPLVWLYLCRFVPRVPLSRMQAGQGAKDVISKLIIEQGRMNSREKFVAFIFLMTVFLWVFRKPIPLGAFSVPGWSGLFPWGSHIHDSTVAMAMGLLLMTVPIGLYQNDQGKENEQDLFALDWKTVANKLPWGILVLFGGGFALASAFKKTGLDLWLGEQFLIVGTFPLLAAIFTISLGVIFLTELSSNTAITTLILPVIASLAIATKIEPLMLMIPAAVSASFAFMMPIATPPNAIVFGSGWLTISQMSKAGFILNILGATCISFLTLYFTKTVFFN